MPAATEIITLPNGIAIAHNSQGETAFVYREIFEDNCYLQHGIAVNKGDCVFDVGANIGLFSLYLSQLVQGLQIYAFEPLPPLYRLLQENCVLCELKNVHTFPIGLSATAGIEIFTFYPNNSIMSGRYADELADREIVKIYLRHQLEEAGASLVPTDALLNGVAKKSLAGERYECELKTLSEVIAEQGIKRIDLLKLDVEKSEMDVLRGIAYRDWEKIRQLVIEVYDDGEQLAVIETMLRQHGFRFVVEQDKCLRDSPVYMVYARKA